MLYLAEVAGHDPGEILERSVSYNRTRTFNPGDDLPFRPGLHLLLASEYLVFGRSQRGWQAFAILAQIAATAALFFALRGVRGSLAASLLAIHWSTLRAASEAVLWHHVTGYVVFVALLLLGLDRLRRALSAGDQRDVTFAAVLLGLSATFHELGVVAATLGAAALAFEWRRSPAARIRLAWTRLAAVPVLYIVASATDLVLRGISPGSSGGGGFPSPIALVPATVRTLASWLVHGAFPSLVSLSTGDRLTAKWAPLGVWELLPAMAALGGLALFGVFLARSTRLRDDRALRVFAIVVAALIASEAAMFSLITLARGGDLAANLNTSLYYGHAVWALLTLLAACCVDRAPNVRGVLRGAAVVALLAATAQGAYGTWTIGQRYIPWSAPRIALLEALARFHAAHGAEPDFSLWAPVTPIDFDAYVGIPATRRGGPPGPESYTLAEMLYPREFRREKPPWLVLPTVVGRDPVVTVPGEALAPTVPAGSLCVDWGDGAGTRFDRAAGAGLPPHRYARSGLFLIAIRRCAGP